MKQETPKKEYKRSPVLIWGFALSIIAYILQLFDRVKATDYIVGIIVLAFAFALIIQEINMVKQSGGN